MDDVDSLAGLRREIEELRASRARVVAAANADRRGIERDLHDGAQQHLVALAVNLQLVRQLAGTDPEAAGVLLDEIGHDAREALESIRGLAHRIYPPLLPDRGLVEALRAAAASLDVRVSVEAEPLDRYPAELEANAYFCCVDVLESLIARGEGVRVTVRVWTDENALRFEVRQDKRGSDESGRLQMDLTHVADRLAALDGRLVVISEHGTRVSGSIPLMS